MSTSLWNNKIKTRLIIQCSVDGPAHQISGVGSNRVLGGPPIQIVGVALITEFCDHNYY
jgi:hypothetical protein